MTCPCTKIPVQCPTTTENPNETSGSVTVHRPTQTVNECPPSELETQCDTNYIGNGTIENPNETSGSVTVHRPTQTVNECPPSELETQCGTNYVGSGTADNPIPTPRSLNPIPKTSEIIIPLAFHLMSGITMNKNDKPLNVWVTPTDIPYILNEINKIWKQASIKFETLVCTTNDLPLTNEQIEQVKIVETSEGRKSKSRIKAIRALTIHSGVHTPKAVNVYLIPYMGATNQGLSGISKPYAIAGVWTDKPSKGKLPPTRTKFIEPLPMQDGSLTRTIAHELGHALGLTHPETSKIPRLMGGPIQGYNLTITEITTARQQASKYLTTILKSLKRPLEKYTGFSISQQNSKAISLETLSNNKKDEEEIRYTPFKNFETPTLKEIILHEEDEEEWLWKGSCPSIPQPTPITPTQPK